MLSKNLKYCGLLISLILCCTACKPKLSTFNYTVRISVRSMENLLSQPGKEVPVKMVFDDLKGCKFDSTGVYKPDKNRVFISADSITACESVIVSPKEGHAVSTDGLDGIPVGRIYEVLSTVNSLDKKLQVNRDGDDLIIPSLFEVRQSVIK